MRYRLLVWSLRLVVLVSRLTGLKGHIVADAEGDAGYYKLEAHKGEFMAELNRRAVNASFCNATVDAAYPAAVCCRLA